MEGYIGQVMLFAGLYAPDGWHDCDGTILNVSDYQALYSILGNSYGGTQSKTFNLPDLRSRVPVGLNGADSAANPVGHTSSPKTIKATVQLQPSNVPAPAVTVTLPVVSDSTPTGTPTGNAVKLAAQGVAGGSDTVNYYSANAGSPVVANLTANVTASGSTTPTPVDISQPYVVMRYIICVSGMYPERP